MVLFGDRAQRSRQVAQELNRRHPQRNRIRHGTAASVNKLFTQTGSALKNRPAIDNPQRNQRNDDDYNILGSIRANPQINFHERSQQLNLSRDKIETFKLKFLHTLKEGDEYKRLDFLNARNFLRKILFTDEATLTTNRIVSAQNCGYWSIENPYRVINCRMTPFILNTITETIDSTAL
nr:uncharacterized protein LOC111512914 [Leptinotarsa decemlineata]